MAFSSLQRGLFSVRNPAFVQSLVSRSILCQQKAFSSLKQNSYLQNGQTSNDIFNPVQRRFYMEKTFGKDATREFMAVFPDIVRELTIEGFHKDLPVINKHLSKVIQYNVPNGKKNRGMAVPLTFRTLKPNATEEEMRLAYVLGWCVEMLQAFFLVSDDIMDGSEMRRGQPCWYKKDNLGAIAFNDALLLETCIYSLLELHFRGRDYYPQLLHAFLKTTRHTTIGQSLDTMTSRAPLEDFDMKRYSSIVKYKTSYYSFFLPVALGMNMAGITNPELYRQARTILLEMGHFFQVQDDYLDVFGDQSKTGKNGTDIQERKCSWLIVVAMQRATKEQKKILKDCYGQDDPEKVENVLRVYHQLNLPKVLQKYEDESYNDIMMHIDQLSGGGKLLPPKLFHIFLNKIYKRES